MTWGGKYDIIYEQSLTIGIYFQHLFRIKICTQIDSIRSNKCKTESKQILEYQDNSTVTI